jgi:hypothetical protein
MTQSFQVELLHGLMDADRRHTRAVLREPNGHDEAMLAENGGATPAENASALIGALTLRVGALERPSADRLRQLTAGDRERLMLSVSVRLLGADIDLVTPCPSCRNLIEVPVRFADLIAARPEQVADRIELEASEGIWMAGCRPPTGLDLEWAARAGASGGRALLVGSLIELIDAEGNDVAAHALPRECEGRLAEALAQLDPAAECGVEIACPSCAEPIAAMIDGFTILRTALGGARLYDEVYRMARAYHWSEAEILSLPLRRRQHYLAIAEGAETRP